MAWWRRTSRECSRGRWNALRHRATSWHVVILWGHRVLVLSTLIWYWWRDPVLLSLISRWSLSRWFHLVSSWIGYILVRWSL